MSQRLHRLNCIFYTDTLFAKEKSILENICAKIFTNREFVQIIPMISRSEAGTILYRINRYIRVTKETFMENAPDQTGYNT